MQRSDCIITALALAICYWLKPWQTHSSWADWSGSVPYSLIFFRVCKPYDTQNPRVLKLFTNIGYKRKDLFSSLSSTTTPFSHFLLWTQYLNITSPRASIFLNRVWGLESYNITVVISMVIVWWMMTVYGWMVTYLHVDKECLLSFLTTPQNLPAAVWPRISLEGSGKVQSKKLLPAETIYPAICFWTAD